MGEAAAMPPTYITKQLHFMEIVNIEAGTFKEMVMSIQLLKEKLENLKGW